MTTTDTPQSQVELSDAAKVLRLRNELRRCVTMLRCRGLAMNHFVIRDALEVLEKTKLTNIKTT